MRFSLKIFLIIFAAFGLQFFTSSQATASKMQTGVSYVHDNELISFKRVKQAGATYVHGWIRWHQIAPKVEPKRWNPKNPFDKNYDWQYYDDWMRNAKRAGLIPIGHIYYAPTWAQRCKSDPKYSATNPPCNLDPNKMAAFGKAAAERYSGKHARLPRVKYWQPQNEPNLALFFYPQFNKNNDPVSPDLYREVLNKFYDAIKSVNSSNQVISAGLAPNGNAVTVAPMEFTRRLLCMQGKRVFRPARSKKCVAKMDAFDMHPYTSGSPTHKGSIDNVQLGDLRKLKKLLAAADRAGHIQGDRKRTPLWITEMSWDSNRPDPGGVKMNVLTRWTAEAIYQAQRAGVDKFFWYSLRDQDPGNRPWSETAQSGLFFRGVTVAKDRPKPIIKAFRFPFVAFSKPAKRALVWGRTPNSKRGLLFIQYKRGKRWLNIARAHPNKHGVFKALIRTRFSNKKGYLRARYGTRHRVRYRVRRRIRGTRRFRVGYRVKRRIKLRGTSAPFSLTPVKDFKQAPFGNPGF